MRKASAKEFYGAAVKARREELGKTLDWVATELKLLNRTMFGSVTAGSVSGWERGAKPSADVPPNLAIVLRCAVSRLYRNADA